MARMQPLIAAVAIVALLVATGGLWLIVTDRVPSRPLFVYHLFVRRRRGVLVEYPPGTARLLGIAVLLYAIGLLALTFDVSATFGGGVPPTWSQYSGWPLLVAFLISVYVFLRVRRAPPT
jgi:hypothetical protein